MQIFRTSMAHVTALSIIASQLLCGCMGDWSQASSIDDAAAHNVVVSTDMPCHGETSGPEEHGSDGEHDCEHCQSASAQGAITKAPNAVLTGERDTPDSGPLAKETILSVVQPRLVFDTGPPRRPDPTLPETLVSKQILLLI